MGNKYYQYYVEGETEKKLLSILKTDFECIIPGKVEKLNLVNTPLRKNRIAVLKKPTIVIIVFDTDTGNSDLLDKNIAFLKKQRNISDIICISQVNNLEDELTRSCQIKEVRELTGSKSNSDFKRDMIQQSNFGKKLIENGFNIEKFWNRPATNGFAHITNEAIKVKLAKKF
ncbi:MAG: hypothetical protein ACK5MN_02050 [Lachnospiraceae bacterium]